MTLPPARLYVVLYAIVLMAAHGADAAPKQKNNGSSPYTGGVTVGFHQLEHPLTPDAPLSFEVATAEVTAAGQNSYLTYQLSRNIAAGEVSRQDDTGHADWEDRNITVGYRLGARLWAFAGKNEGDISLNLASRRDGGPEGGAFQEQDGIYYGFAYNYPLERSVLKFSVTYSDLDTEHRFTNTPADIAGDFNVEFHELPGRRSGTREGYRYAVAWLVPLSNTVYYQTRYQKGDHDLRVNVDDLNGPDRTVQHSAEASHRQLTVGFKFLF